VIDLDMPVPFRIEVEGAALPRFIPMIVEAATKITPMDGGTLTITLGEAVQR
jgi:hypothetical protein